MNTELSSILQALDLPVPSQKIYKELLEQKEATARQLSTRLGITRPSTYDHLDILVKRGFVVEKKIENKTYFALNDIRHIDHLLEDKIEALKKKKDDFSALLPSLLKEVGRNAPVIKFFEGKEGLSHLFHDLLWCKGETVYSMWPHDEIEKVMGKEFLIRFNDKRIREKIHVCALWPHDMKPKDGYIWKDKDAFTKRKYAKSGQTWGMGYTIYGDKVSFISSDKEVFGFIVQSKEFVSLMKLQFDSLWETAKEK